MAVAADVTMTEVLAVAMDLSFIGFTFQTSKGIKCSPLCWIFFCFLPKI